jgi:hypothetical protein
MCMKAYSQKTRKKVEKIIEEHVSLCRRNIPWSGENDVVSKKIMKLFRENT